MNTKTGHLGGSKSFSTSASGISIYVGIQKFFRNEPSELDSAISAFDCIKGQQRNTWRNYSYDDELLVKNRWRFSVVYLRSQPRAQILIYLLVSGNLKQTKRVETFMTDPQLTGHGTSSKATTTGQNIRTPDAHQQPLKVHELQLKLSRSKGMYGSIIGMHMTISADRSWSRQSTAHQPKTTEKR